VEHGKAVFELSRRQKDGNTLREHLEAVEQATGQRPPELDPPPLPPECSSAWLVFGELHGRRGGNGFGPSPLDERRLLDWQALHRVELTPFEVACVFALDDAWLTAEEEAKKKTNPNAGPDKPH
jgi:hypothetical protein